ncbi:UDP-N-acetylmuramoylalanyl-D-glutamate--2,6-diaminopimelate ligase [Knoellia sinensis KCTC 19936]|uniref:UDP-N-acetylmuramoyl-L-alanyl-D-glutamate--2,6-diaminopimelate ligase n=1 Tax=Knoellia sinensis KCTC 19936 TaxID=1385520 RepID=A0A0A0J7G5_9MICO|nr:UDP-N-acetylmuramoyl-L-alanyl-D-glutamate--2,6-diaminopimelate ligase [Knoellia sinensis]KGN33113.1 UDP-N-acetylmuramoylalanyl-D-glutamate--2,6-diaminopimelate ligase [Knoellia sinensis KCTC 19936]
MSAPRPASHDSSSLRGLALLIGASPDSFASPDSGASHGDVADVTVTGVTLDSRAVQNGDLYAALPGARAHGADFAAQAAASGAAAVLTDADGASRMREAGVALPSLVVENPRSVLGAVASAIYDTADQDLTMIGITGTNGKTTTAYLVASALGVLGHRTGLIGTVETRIGDERIKSVRTTPEATDLHAILAVMEERDTDTCVMEVSSHALSQHRVDGVVYDLALFTNLSQDHLDFHADMEDYFSAKAQLFTRERSVRGLVCVDDIWGRRLVEQSGVPVATLTTQPDQEADWIVTVDEGEPSRFTLRGNGTELDLRSALPGDFNVANTAMAAVALLLIGEEVDAVSRAILTDPHVPGRMEKVVATAGGAVGSDDLLAVVDYAHTPDAVEAALTALRSAATGRLVVVLGAGGDRDMSKRHGMGRAAAGIADVVVVTDDNPRSEEPSAIRAAVLEGAQSVATDALLVEVDGRHRAIREAVRLAREGGPGSIVAVVGKGHETGQEVGGVVHPFDDRDELRLALDAADPADDSAPTGGTS